MMDLSINETIKNTINRGRRGIAAGQVYGVKLKNY